LSAIVLVALIVQLYFLRPKANDFVDAQEEKKYTAIADV
jgi:septation ring formation regulator EzrA